MKKIINKISTVLAVLLMSMNTFVNASGAETSGKWSGFSGVDCLKWMDQITICVTIFVLGLIIMIISEIALVVIQDSVKMATEEETLKKARANSRVLTAIVYAVISVFIIGGYYLAELMLKYVGILTIIPIVIYMIMNLVMIIRGKESYVVSIIVTIFACLIIIAGQAFIYRDTIKYNNEVMNDLLFSGEISDIQCVMDVNSIVDYVKESGKKITIVLDDTSYKTSDELDKLNDIVDGSYKYFAVMSYKDYLIGGIGQIDTINIIQAEKKYSEDFIEYDGINSGDKVVDLLEYIADYEEDIDNVSVQWAMGLDSVEISEDDLNVVDNIKQQIDTSKEYVVSVTDIVGSVYICVYEGL